MTFYFAWVDEGDNVFSESSHAVEDEQLFGFAIEHSEGDFPSLTVILKNPRVGILNPNRKHWAWLSWDSEASNGIIPLFFGRVVGIPDELEDELISLQFRARPPDFVDRKEALAATLRTRPFYDPIWFDEAERDNPDNVLEARSALWHVDRVTHDVTISDIITGEDGTFTPQTLLDVTTEIGQTPVRKVFVNAQVSFEQKAKGTVNITRQLIDAFQAAGSSKPGLITSYTGEGLEKDWPDKGDSIGSGWSIGTTTLDRADTRTTPQTIIAGSNFPRFKGISSDTVLASNITTVIPLWSFNATMNLDYDVSRSYFEDISFTVESDLQAVVTEPGDDEILRIETASRQVNEPIDSGDSETAEDLIPLQDTRRRSYINTDRGLESLEYLIALARAKLLARSRAVNVACEIPFGEAVDLSLRQNALVIDARLPGGQAFGKITNYSLSMDPTNGRMVGNFAIGCAVGNGNTVTSAAGTPTYVETGYVEVGYQFTDGQLVEPIAGEITYESFEDIEPSDDGVNFFEMTGDNILDQSISSGGGIQVFGGEAEQLAVIKAPDATLTDAAIETFFDRYGIGDPTNVLSQNFRVKVVSAFLQATPAETAEALNAVHTEVLMDLVPLQTGPFTTQYPITVSNLMVPKGIDLEST